MSNRPGSQYVSAPASAPTVAAPSGLLPQSAPATIVPAVASATTNIPTAVSVPAVRPASATAPNPGAGGVAGAGGAQNPGGAPSVGGTPGTGGPPAAAGVPAAGGGAPVGSAPPTGTQRARPAEWLPTVLRRAWLVGFAAATVALIAVDAALAAVSLSRGGFARVPTRAPIEVAQYEVSAALLWTTLPVFVVTLYTSWFAAMSVATGLRQPYVDLNPNVRPGGAKLKESFLLNYSSYPLGKNALIAVRRGHPTLAFGFVLSGVLSFVLTSFTSHLFFTQPVARAQPATITSSVAIDVDNINSTTPLASSLDTAIAVLAFGAISPPWTSDTYSFQRFDMPAGGASGNVSSTVNATSAQLSCASIDANSALMQSSSDSYEFAVEDRGCFTTGQFEISAVAPDESYHDTVQTYSKIDCGGGAAGDARIVVISFRTTRADLVTYPIVLSCEPSYAMYAVELMVDYSQATAAGPLVSSFSVTQTIAFDPPRPLFAVAFEPGIVQSAVFDASDETSDTDLGRLIVGFARVLQPNGNITVETMSLATEQAFTSAYAYAADTYLWQQQSAASAAPGAVYVDEVRLFVYQPFAWATVGMLCLTLLYTAWLAWYVFRDQSTLFEEPRSILGAATLLINNDFIEKDVAAAISNSAVQGKVWDHMANPDDLIPAWRVWDWWSGKGKPYCGIFHTRLSKNETRRWTMNANFTAVVAVAVPAPAPAPAP